MGYKLKKNKITALVFGLPLFIMTNLGEINSAYGSSPVFVGAISPVSNRDLMDLLLTNDGPVDMTCKISASGIIKNGDGIIGTVLSNPVEKLLPANRDFNLFLDFSSIMKKRRRSDNSWKLVSVKPSDIEISCIESIEEPAEGQFRNYKLDPKWKYKWSQWCNGDVPGMNSAEIKLVKYISAKSKFLD